MKMINQNLIKIKYLNVQKQRLKGENNIFLQAASKMNRHLSGCRIVKWFESNRRNARRFSLRKNPLTHSPKAIPSFRLGINLFNSECYRSVLHVYQPSCFPHQMFSGAVEPSPTVEPAPRYRRWGSTGVHGKTVYIPKWCTFQVNTNLCGGGLTQKKFIC